MSRHVAIVGGGYSGALLAIALVRRGARATLIDRGARPGRGIAYATPWPDHLLNVRADRMSAFADAPDDFARWLAVRGIETAGGFAERQVYGEYIETLLAEAAAAANGRLAIVPGTAVAVERAPAGQRVRLFGGATIDADVAVLSVGNLPPETPSAIDPGLAAGLYRADPWDGDPAAGLGAADAVLLIGTGLTAIDAALMLDAAGFGGTITALSRRGLVPRTHAQPPAPVPPLASPPAGALSQAVHAIRAQADLIGWQAAIDQLRPHTQPLWAAAGIAERRRFLRHLRPYWDVHRHRIAPAVAARIGAMRKAGRLHFAAGRVVMVRPDDDIARVTWRPRGSDEVRALDVRRIVNCTGPSGDLVRSGEPLLANLLGEGRIRPDPLRIGIDVDADCRVVAADGTPDDGLRAIGPMTRGAWWEIVAVPDLRVQIGALAAALV